MSESSSPMEQFNINELAGASAIILTGISGILVVIFKSRCYCKFRVGCSDKCNLCMCERKPPPDTPDEDEEKPTEPIIPPKTATKEKPKLTKQGSRELEPQPEPEIDKLV